MNEHKPKYCYEFPRPALTADVIIFTFHHDLKVLLIQRVNEPFKGLWAFPGGFVNENETVLDAAKRELLEETGLLIEDLELIHIASDPERDPRGWIISALYIGFVNYDNTFIRAGDDALSVKFHSLHEKQLLAFDHDMILTKALKKLKHKAQNFQISPVLLNENFFLKDLELLIRCILGSESKGNQLSTQLIKYKIITTTDQCKTYRFDEKYIS
jgi:8-oxo-dGTP diphosphatase